MVSVNSTPVWPGTAATTSSAAGSDEPAGRPARSRVSGPGVTGTPPRRWTVLVAIHHLLVRDLAREVLQQGGTCSTVTPEDGEMLADALARCAPDLLVVDTGDFPACCREALRSFPRDRVVVVGPEPADDYYHSAIGLGAGAWISRDALADDLLTRVLALLPGR